MRDLVAILDIERTETLEPKSRKSESPGDGVVRLDFGDDVLFRSGDRLALGSITTYVERSNMMPGKALQETVFYGEDNQRGVAVHVEPPGELVGKPGKAQAGFDPNVTWLEVDDSWYAEQAGQAEPPASIAAESEKLRLQALAAVAGTDRSVTVTELPFVEAADGLPLVQVAAPQTARKQALSPLVNAPTDASLSGRSTVLPKVEAEGAALRLVGADKARYEAIAPLGSGGAGDVLLAQDNDINRKVALKKLKRQRHTPPDLRRFVDEIRMMGSLEHPNIVPIHDVGLDDQGHFYFVMKYIEGQTMADVIDKLVAGDEETHKRFPYEVRFQIFLKILQAVEFAHNQGVIHRDLKPSNIMIGPYGEVMVVDWGLAKQIRENQGANTDNIAAQESAGPLTVRPDGRPRRWFETRHDTLLGTPAYMSPEQALGHNQNVDERSDIYSLSAIFYEFVGLAHYMSHKESLQELLFGIVSEEPKVLIQRKHPAQPPISVEYCHFVRRGLEKSPAARFQSVKEMRENLQDAIAGNFAIQCPVTLNRRIANGWLRLIDRFPFISLFAMLGGAGIFLLGCYKAILS